MIFYAPKHCHITPLLQQLHWLPIRILLSTPKRFTKVTMGDRSLMAAAGHGFGTVFPLSIRSDYAKSDFKQKLKTFLFSKALG